MNREDLRPIYAPPRPGDIKHSVADITRAMGGLRFKPSIRLEDGLRDLVSVYGAR